MYLLQGTNITTLPKELNQRQNTNNLLQDRKLALENTKKSHNYNKTLFDKNRKEVIFNSGDMVYIENGNRLNRKKLDEIKIGSFKIIEKLSNSIYKIDTGHKKAESKLIPAPDITEDIKLDE